MCTRSLLSGILLLVIVTNGISANKLDHLNLKDEQVNPNPNDIVPIVTTPLGQLRGQAEKSRSGKWFYSFQGIPFAQPQQRFQLSTPVEPWDGILDTREVPIMCPQLDMLGGVQGDENCLFLNVYFPHYDRCQSESSSGGLPVLFNIHGGSFSSGAGSIYGPKYLLDECIVYVSTNYRIGALGFLTTGDDVVTGNLGLKDQVLALNFTRNYISYFRGDPDLITIMGISAGASSVSHLITSPMARGLFKTAITSSGSVLSPWSIIENPGLKAINLGQKLNCPVDSSLNLKTCLESVDYKEIILNQAEGFSFPFGPIVEPSFASTPFQTENPIVLLKNGDFSQVPLISGFVQDENVVDAAYILGDPAMTDLLNNFWSSVAPVLLQYNEFNIEESQLNLISSKIRDFYFGNELIGPETRQNLINLISDRFMVQGTFESVELHSKFAPVYGYVMTYKGGASAANAVGYEIPVIAHADDSQYTFNMYGLFPEFSTGSEQIQFSRQLIEHFVNFVKNGNPGESFGNSESGGWNATIGSANAIWHQLDLSEGNFENYLNERRTFWINLGLYEYEHSDK